MFKTLFEIRNAQISHSNVRNAHIMSKNQIESIWKTDILAKCLDNQCKFEHTVHINWLNPRTFMSPTALYSGIRQHSKLYFIKRENRVSLEFTRVNSLPSVLWYGLYSLQWSVLCVYPEDDDPRALLSWGVVIALDVSRAKVERNLSERLLRWSFPCHSVVGITLGEMNGVRVSSGFWSLGFIINFI